MMARPTGEQAEAVVDRWPNRRIIFVAVVVAFIFYAVFRLPTTISYLLVRVQETLTLLILAVALAYFLLPLTDLLTRIPVRLERRLKRTVASLLSITIFLVLLVVLGTVIVTPISEEIGKLLKTVTEWAQRDLATQVDTLLNDVLSRLPEPYASHVAEQIRQLEEQLSGPTLVETIRTRIGEWGKAILAWQVDLVATVLSSGRYLIALLIVPVFTFYFLTDASVIREGIGTQIPPETRAPFHLMVKDMDRVMRGYTQTVIVISLLTGVATTLILYFAGVQTFLTFGIMAGVANLIPVVGGIIATVLLIAISLLTVGFKRMLVVMAAFLVVQIVTDRVLAPKLMSEGTKLHPIAVIIALLFGAEFFGAIGLFVAVPVLAAARVVWIHYQAYMSDEGHQAELDELIGRTRQREVAEHPAGEAQMPAEATEADDAVEGAADNDATDGDEPADGDA